MTGERFGQWILGTPLGRGTVGEVYRAESATDLGAVAAVKVLDHPQLQSAEFLNRFPAQFLALKRLGHPNLVGYLDAGVARGRAWYATELVDGVTLEQLLKSSRGGLAPAADGLRVAAQLARALKHGHNRQLLHGQWRLSSVFVTPQGVVKLGDFGLARLLPLAPSDYPLAGFGVLGYLAPEVVSGKPATRKSDVYSLGGVYYSLFTGRPMVQAQTLAEFVRRQCYALPDRPCAFVPGLPAELDDLICELIQKDPARRPASASAVLAELDAVRGKLERKGQPVAWPAAVGDESGPLAALSPETESAPGPQTSRPLMARPAVVVPLFLLIVGVTLALLFRPRPTADELLDAARQAATSSDPADWQRATDELLPELRDTYPDAAPAEVRALESLLRDRQDLDRTLTRLRLAPRVNQPPAEALYRRGLKLAEAGDFTGASRHWHAVELLPPSTETTPYADLARTALDRLPPTPPVTVTPLPPDAAAELKALLTDPGATDAGGP